MRRQSAFPVDREADQSISDDDKYDRVVYDHDCLENLRPVCRRGNKGELQVLSQLERLEGEQLLGNNTCELNAGDRKNTASLEELKIFFPEDEIELETCYIHIEEEFLHTDQRDVEGLCNDEVISDDDSSLHAAKSEARKFQKGCGAKTKHKFSIHLPLQKDELSCPSVLKYENAKLSDISQISLGLEAEHSVTEHSMTVLLERLQKENEKPSEASKLPGRLTLPHRATGNSMAEILEGLQEKNGSLGEGCNMSGNMKERWFQHDEKKTLTSLGNRSLGNEDPLENMDCQTSSEDDDGNQNHLSQQILGFKQQTMMDRFQQAFNPVALDEEVDLFPISKHLGSGYYGRLQQVMQKEKHRHIEFLKQLQTGAGLKDESGCIDVQLLSRYLDAKLTVCHCKLLGNIKCLMSPQKSVHGGTNSERVIVFSPRVCSDVELEVGNTIRVHPPWKEVQVTENEIVILCTYFSQFPS